MPNSLSDDPEQDIECVLDHYDYMANLVGVDHVGIGTDTTVGDHVAFHRVVMGRDGPDQLPAPYLNAWSPPPMAATSPGASSAAATPTTTSAR